jgi:putative photosynthetic complex assembly protein
MSTMEGPMMPRWFVPVTGLVLAGVLGFSAVSRIDQVHVAGAPSIASASLRFADEPNGSVQASTADGRVLAQIPARDDGFLRMTLRLLAEQRMAQGFNGQTPFILTEQAGGHFILTDPTIGQHVELEAFGPSNVAEFSSLLQDAQK